MTLTGMKKHVSILEDAGLVTTEKVGRVRTARLGPRKPRRRNRFHRDVSNDGRGTIQPARGFPRAHKGEMMATTTKEAPAKATLTTPSDREIRVERIFNASRDRVWKAFTEPELIAQWWGRGNKLVIEKMEVERGGHWRVVEHADGQASWIRGTLSRGHAAGPDRAERSNGTGCRATHRRDR